MLDIRFIRENPDAVNSFEFHRCRRTPQVEYLTLSLYRLHYIANS